MTPESKKILKGMDKSVLGIGICAGVIIACQVAKIVLILCHKWHH